MDVNISLNLKGEKDMEVREMSREFVYNGIKLPDPDPRLSAEQVRDTYTPAYAELTTAAIEGPEVQNDRLVYRFVRAVGAKG